MNKNIDNEAKRLAWAGITELLMEFITVTAPLCSNIPAVTKWEVISYHVDDVHDDVEYVMYKVYSTSLRICMSWEIHLDYDSVYFANVDGCHNIPSDILGHLLGSLEQEINNRLF